MMNDRERPDLTDALPCPFCGSFDLGVTDWWDDDGEFYAIECGNCKGSAPADIWNNRDEEQRL